MKTHLTVLQILHYVMAGLNLLWGGYLVAIAVFFLFVGAATGPGSGPGGPPFPIYLMGLFYLCPGILTLAVLVLNVMAGNNIAKARRRNLCIAAAIANLIPFLSCCYIVGIPLGVYGLVILFNAQTVQIFKHVERGVPFSEINSDGTLGRDKRSSSTTAGSESDDNIESDGAWDESKKPPNGKGPA